jgi:hypothetical protein
MQIEVLLTTTRSARKSLDLGAPIADLYRAAYLEKVGGQSIAGLIQRFQVHRRPRRAIDEVVGINGWEGR